MRRRGYRINIVFFACLVLISTSLPANAGTKRMSSDVRDSGELMEALGEGALDRGAIGKNQDTATLKKCLAAFKNGDRESGKKLWGAFLDEMGGKDSLDAVTRTIDAQLFFAETKSKTPGLTMFTDLVQVTKAKLGPQHHYVADLDSTLSEWYVVAKRFPEAEAAVRDEVAVHAKNYGPLSHTTVISQCDLVQVFLNARDYGNAEKEINNTIKLFEKRRSPEMQRSYNQYVQVLKATGRTSEIPAVFQRYKKIASLHTARK